MWKDWLALSKREQKGFVVLSIILISLIVFYFLTPLLFYSDMQNRTEADKDLVDWIDSVNSINSIEVALKPDSLFFFDPNEVTITKLQKLGVAGPALINWLKYRERGSRFKNPEDILKIYLLDSALAVSLMPYVKFNTNGVKKGKYTRLYVDKSGKKRVFKRDSKPVVRGSQKKYGHQDSFVIEINSADTAEFAVLKGIGHVLSSRIVLYRKALGGFVDVEQLKEVYGMPANTIDENSNYLTVDSLAISKIDINRVSLRRLKKHPYIDFYLAKAIVEYRRDNDSIKNIDEILSFKEVKPELKNKLAVYLTVEDEN
jgi:competence ComEA-like helix-hairpin-helix protein